MTLTILSDLRRARWMGGQLLAFSGLDGPTDFQLGLVGRTSFESPGVDIRLPGRCRVRFVDAPAESAGTVTGDAFEIPSAGIRGAFLDTHHLLIEGRCRVEDVSDSVAFRQREGRLLVGVATRLDPALLDADLDGAWRARNVWLGRRALPGGVPDRTRRALVKALSILKTQVYTPEGMIRHRWTTPDRWPHRRLWLWDSAFHAIGWRHIDADLARDAISAVLDTQRKDGFVALMMDPETITEKYTQPPVLAMAAQRVHAVAPEPEWIREIYPKLGAYVAWDMAHRDTDGAGLIEWTILGDPLCRSGESGMDNSPRFDTATRLDAVDFNAFLAHECEVLAEFAALLGEAAQAARWRAEHARLCGLINRRLWSEPLGFYMDYDLDQKAQSPVLASSGFLPLLCGAPSSEQARRLVAHLGDPRMFGTALPVPSVAVCDAAHYAKDMWRGPVWVNVNWLIAEGLDRYGFRADAASLRQRTAAAVEEMAERYGTLFEFYDDRAEVDPPRLLRKGCCDASPDSPGGHLAIHDYGWTASLYVDMAYRLAGRACT